MYTIRPYKHSDFKEIVNWWNNYDEHGPQPGMMIEDGTFVLELHNVPALSLTVFLTQSKEISYLEGLIKNPLFKNVDLDKYTQKLFNHCFTYAKEKGYNRIICYSKVSKLSDKYERFGFFKAMNNLSGLVREL